MVFAWRKPEANEHGLQVRHTRCGRAFIVKLNPPEGRTFYSEFVPVLDWEFLPRYYRLGDAKLAVECAESGKPLPPVGKPRCLQTRYDVTTPGANEESYKKTAEWFRENVLRKQKGSPSVTDPFAVLGVPRTASLADCRKAYRNLQVKVHPDHNDAPDATEKFQEIKAAWEKVQELLSCAS